MCMPDGPSVDGRLYDVDGAHARGNDVEGITVVGCNNTSFDKCTNNYICSTEGAMDNVGAKYGPHKTEDTNPNVQHSHIKINNCVPI